MKTALRLLFSVAVLSGMACACNDSTLMSGAGNDFRPCGMSCIERDGKSCNCTGQCPCWKRGSGGRRHRLSSEGPPPEAP